MGNKDLPAMKLQDQVCAIEQAKKLKDLGVSQVGLFCYIGDSNPDPKYHTPYNLYYAEWANGTVGKSWFDNRLAAFTVAELGIMLPSGYESMHNTGEGWRCYDLNGQDVMDGYGYVNEVEARADSIIHLLENKITTVAEVNRRLTK